jgi:parallel beta-helix repeat protein
MKKTIVLALILVCLMVLGLVCIRPVKAQTQNDITINSDGTVSPSTAPIQQKGNIYTLTSDTAGSITVFRNNTILDGNGHATDGVIVGEITNATIADFTVTGGLIGMYLFDSSNITVANNTISQTANNSPLPLGGGLSTSGIYVIGGSSNIITGNNLFNNTLAIYLLGTGQNTIIQNNITGSSYAGIDFDSSSNNIIYHNNFINNSRQAIDTGLYAFYQTVPLNTWDDGYPFGGNYWSNYKTTHPNATEIDSSGIGDMPYVVYVNNTDQFPLMEPFTIATYLQETTPPKISLLSPLNRTYDKSIVPLVFTVDKLVNWTAYSLDGKQNVTITSNTTITNMTNGLHTLTVYANDTYGNRGASQTVVFTITKPEPFPIATVALVSGIAAVVVVVGLLVYFKKRKPKTHRVIEGEIA